MVGKDAKPGSKNLGENAGQEFPDTAVGVRVNTIYDEESEVINLKEMNLGMTGEFNN